MYIEWYIQTVQQITRTLIHKNQFTSLCRGQKPASKCIRLVYEILVIYRALQALYTLQRCEPMKTTTKKKINTNCSYRIFIVCRSPLSPVFWARILLTYNGSADVFVNENVLKTIGKRFINAVFFETPLPFFEMSGRLANEIIAGIAV